MDYQVSARKYRPMSFAEVSGQPHVVRTLTNAIAAGRTAHAYLFSGMRGVGKTTMARILAKALNCERGPTATPCLACPSCVEIGRGASFDVLEIDGASSNSVDDVREMRETIKTAPARGRYRVYIIDEVHMLSMAAFNALLKTLEEPPPHVVFVFATTEFHKIPQTILSRCQHFTFRRISRRELMETLHRVVKAEGIEIDDRCLSALARTSDGSMRDALSLLDQAVAFGGKRVTGDDLMALLGSVPRELLRGVFDALLDQNGAQALRVLAEVQDRGCDLRQFCGELVEHVRNLLVSKIVADADDLIDLSSEEQAEIRADAARLQIEQVQELLRIFLQAEEGLRASQHPWFVLEMAIIRAGRLGTDKGGVSPPPAKPGTRAMARPAPPAAAPQPVRPTLQRQAPAAESPSEQPQPTERSHSAEPLTPARESPLSPTRDPKPVALDWEAVVSRVHAERPNLGAYLEDAALVGVEDEVVTIGYPASAGASMKIIQREEYQRVIAGACAALCERPLRLRVVTLEAGSAKTLAHLRREREAATASRLREEALANPLVQEALSVFGGEVQEVRRKRSRPEQDSKATRFDMGEENVQ
jgi:DNA polymerase-3 subunit gamma/tau